MERAIAEHEVQHLWARPKSQSAYWFFVNRYFAFTSHIVVLVMAFTNNLSTDVCRVFSSDPFL